MMKIQVTETGGQVVLQVAGRLAGAFVTELENCWRGVQVEQPGRGIAIDMKEVTCIDRCGRRLLYQMHSEGTAFLRAGLAIQDVLEQIMEQQGCP